MQVQVKWKQGLAFDGAADSGFSLNLGADPEAGGGGEGFRPMELMALSLAGCTAMDVISILQKKRQQVSGFEVHLDAQRAEEHPKVFTGAVIRYLISGQGVDEAAVLRAIELSAQRYCPAQAMLGQVFPIDLRYEIYEMGEGERTLIKEGHYNPA